MAAPAHAPMTLDEFLLREERQPTKHEFSYGRIVARAGATEPHVLITPNLNGLVYARLRGSYQDANTKLRVEAVDASYYPEGMVACPPNFVNSRQGTIDNPTVIFEVLSPVASGCDVGEKLGVYFSIPTLREYVVISSGAAAVTVHERRGEEWVTRVVLGREATTLASLGLLIPHAELYEGVVFGTVALDPQSSGA